jgi:hypothetical protein
MSWRPALVVGYGECGGRWLRKVRDVLKQDLGIQERIEAGVIQFWCITDEDQDAETGIRSLGPSLDEAALRTAVDISRTERNRERFDLELNEPTLILERVPLSDVDGGVRDHFRHKLDTAVRLDCDPRQHQELELAWITLLDGVRSANRPSAAAADNARVLIGSCEHDDVTLFIDRATERGGVIDADLADHLFQTVAVTLLSTRLAAHPAFAPTQVNAMVGQLRPLSVFALRHPPELGLEATGAEFLERLVRRRHSHEVRNALPLSQDLSRLAAEHMNLARKRVRLGPVERRRRLEVFATTLAGVFITDSDDHATTEIAMARQSLAGLVRTPGPRPVNVGVATIPLLDPAWLALVLAGLGAAAWFGWRRKRISRRTVDERAEPVSAQSADSTIVNDWEDWLGALERLLILRSKLAAQGNLPLGMEDHAWASEDTRFERMLTSAARTDQVRLAVPIDACTRICATALEHQVVHTDVDPLESLRKASEQEADRTIREDRHRFTTLLQASLSRSNAEPVAKAFRTQPLFAVGTRPLRTAHVIWATPEEHGLQELLAELESRDLRDRIHFTDTLDRRASTRIALSDPVPIDGIASLSYLKE